MWRSFVIFCLFKVIKSTVVDDGLCALIASTNVATLHTMWTCTAGVANNPCDTNGTPWTGLYCASTAKADLRNIQLTSTLTGTLPSELGLMTNLVNLQMYSNTGLTGTIPSTLGQLTGLTVLNFQDCGLQGSIPTSVCSLTVSDANIRMFGNSQLCYPPCYSKWSLNAMTACMYLHLSTMLF